MSTTVNEALNSSASALNTLQTSNPEQPIELQPKYDNFYTPKNDNFYSNFQYVDLNPAERKIRLLRIQMLKSGEDEKSQVKCELVDDLSLAEMQGNFTTLSYCAGDPKKTEGILVNGIEFNAFANLGHALRQVRHFWKKKYGKQELLLWTDQVCINQSNPNERSHQVGFMGDIYGSAVQVLVCLSVEGDPSGGIESLRQFTSEIQALEQTQSETERMSNLSDLGFALVQERFYDESFHLGWATFLAVTLQSQWWSRAWIRQEFVRCPDAYFLATEESIDWRSVLDGLHWYSSAISTNHKITKHYSQKCSFRASQRVSYTCQACDFIKHPIRFLEVAWYPLRLLHLKQTSNLRGHLSMNLLENLSEMHGCNASDSRDLVYACLGISNQTYGIFADYSPNTSVQDVFVKVAQNAIISRRDLNILHFINQSSQGRRPGSELPTWVPDWRTKPQLWTLPYDKPSRSTNHFSFHEDNQGHANWILQVRGVLVGVIESDPRACLGTKTRWLKEDFLDVDASRLLLVFAQMDDEIYLIHGLDNLCVLRPKGEYFELVDWESRLYGLPLTINKGLDELDEMIERNDAALVDLRLC